MNSLLLIKLFILIIHQLDILKVVKTSYIDKIRRTHIVKKKICMNSFTCTMILLIAYVLLLYYKGYQQIYSLKLIVIIIIIIIIFLHSRFNVSVAQLSFYTWHNNLLISYCYYFIGTLIMVFSFSYFAFFFIELNAYDVSQMFVYILHLF